MKFIKKENLVPNSELPFMVRNSDVGSWAYERLAEPAGEDKIIEYLSTIRKYLIKINGSPKLEIRSCKRCGTEEAIYIP
ncbi:MAG: hypothetical protein ACXADY_25495 [Candidatus Hodarchaeales archaeon]